MPPVTKLQRTLARFLNSRARNHCTTLLGLNVKIALFALIAACSGDVTSLGLPANPIPPVDTTSAPSDTSATTTPPKDSTGIPQDTVTPPRDTTVIPPKDTVVTPPKDTTSTSAAECKSSKTEWIFCDDFEANRLSKYFEYDSAQGSFVRLSGSGVGGSYGMRAHFDKGQTGAGSIKLAIGKTPSSYFRPADQGTTAYREVYWRMYVKNEAGWSGGGGDKLSRAQSIANDSWAQAMIAPVWSGGDAATRDYLMIDPATGTDASGKLLTTKYNDFDNQRYLGYIKGSLPLFDASHVGSWYCVEARVKLNDAGKTNGVFELWINDQKQASRTDLNWVGSYSAYGINTIFFENFWNAGSPKSQSRFIDNIVVSNARIGCQAK